MEMVDESMHSESQAAVVSAWIVISSRRHAVEDGKQGDLRSHLQHLYAWVRCAVRLISSLCTFRRAGWMDREIDGGKDG
jgi:hypothetical protein